MAKVATHLHKFKKVDLARKPGKDPYLVYKCQVPFCNHYVPLHLSEGKVCECSRCHQPMVITKATLTKSKGGALLFPHCEDCTVRRNQTEISALAELLEKKV